MSKVGLHGDGVRGGRPRITLLFLILIWWMSTLFFFGALGKYCDDYSFGMRDPVRSAADWSETPIHRDYFWRPLHQVMTSYLQTILWDSQTLYHWLNAATHGLVALGLWRLGRIVTGGEFGAAAAALLFTALPIHYEVTLWCTSMVISIAAGLWVIVALLYARFARGEREWWSMGVMAALAFAIPCFYEQPGAAIPSLAALYLCLCPRDEPWRFRLWRAGWSTAVLTLTQALYVALLVRTAPKNARGGARSLIEPADLVDRLGDVLGGLRGLGTVRMSHVLSGGISEGSRLAASPFGVAAGVAVALASAVWIWAWARPRERHHVDHDAAPSEKAGHRVIWAWVFALGAAIAVWVPAALLRNQIVEPRMSYTGALGLGLVLAIVLESLVRLGDRSRAGMGIRLASAAVIAGLSAYLALASVGWQALFRARSDADMAQTSQLARLFPDPSPHTMFVCLSDDFRPANTGYSLFDAGLLGWISTSWSASPPLREAMHRRDVHAAPFSVWSGPSVDLFDEKGMRSMIAPFRCGPIVPFPDHPAGGYYFEWPRVVPFIIEASGTVTPVDRLIIERPDGTTFEVVPRLISEAEGLRSTTGATIRVKGAAAR